MLFYLQDKDERGKRDKVKIVNPVRVNNDQIRTVLAKLVNGDLKVGGFDLEESIGRIMVSFFNRWGRGKDKGMKNLMINLSLAYKLTMRMILKKKTIGVKQRNDCLWIYFH